VYCQAPEKPNGWHENWNVSRRSYNHELNTHEEKKAEVIWGASKPSINEEVDNQIDLEAIENVTFTLTGGVTERDLLEEEKEFITKVVLDDTVKSIPNGMFAGCKNLKEIVFNDKVEFIGTRAFADCFSLQEVTIPASIDFISSGAFHSCKLLETVKSYSEFPDAPNFQPLGIFNGCYGITLHVKSQEMKERWETYLKREGNDDSITEIIVMDETEKKTKVTEDVEPEETLLSTIPDKKVLLDTPKWKVVRVLSPEAYAEFIKKGNAPIEGRLNHILSAGAEEFYNRTKGVALYILIDKQSDDRYLFAPKMYAYTIMGYDDYNENIMDFLRNIGTDEALQNWFKRTFTATTRSIQRLQDTQAEVTKRKYAYVYPDDEPIDNRDVAEQIKIVTITEGTTEIEDYAFNNFKGVKEIIIPKSVKKIGRYAFASCNSLISIVIPEGVTKIEENTFWGCRRLEKVTLPNTITEIGDSAFWSCDKLWEINIPRSVTKIGDAAFLGCHILSELFIPASVQTIGVQALEIRNIYYNTIGYGKATIYCEAQSKPAGWNKDWTTSDVEVVWGAKPGLKEDVMNESTNYKLVQLNKSDKHMPEIIKAASDEWGSASKYFTELSDRRIAFKLMDGENIVGFFSIVFDDDTTGEGNIVPWLEKMYTFSQYRKMGVGTIMQKEAEGIAKRKGYDKMFLWTDLNNYYEKTGWKFETDWTGEQGKKVNLYSKDLNKLPETMVGYMVF
jgi:GNAT superfamily N-acetyltransferase/GTPase SAR1 family protein